MVSQSCLLRCLRKSHCAVLNMLTSTHLCYVTVGPLPFERADRIMLVADATATIRASATANTHTYQLAKKHDISNNSPYMVLGLSRYLCVHDDHKAVNYAHLLWHHSP